MLFRHGAQGDAGAAIGPGYVIAASDSPPPNPGHRATRNVAAWHQSQPEKHGRHSIPDTENSVFGNNDAARYAAGGALTSCEINMATCSQQ
jgi:hypothetical protein